MYHEASANYSRSLRFILFIRPVDNLHQRTASRLSVSTEQSRSGRRTPTTLMILAWRIVFHQSPVHHLQMRDLLGRPKLLNNLRQGGGQSPPSRSRLKTNEQEQYSAL